MNGSKILIDTNIVIYYLRGKSDVEKYFLQFSPFVCFISELELLSGAGLYSEEIVDIKRFLSKQTILDYLPGMKDIIVEIRSKKKLKLPDAIIAATAIYLDIPLVSSDKSFAKVNGLKFFYTNPDVF